MNTSIYLSMAAAFALSLAQVLLDRSEARSRVVVTAGVGACVLRVALADTPDRRATGLSNTDRVPDDGLLLRWERPGLHAVWMKDMRYALDLAWIDEAGVIRALVERAQPCAALPCSIYAPPGAASAIAVLETSSGRMASCAASVRDTVYIDADAGGAR